MKTAPRKPTSSTAPAAAPERVPLPPLPPPASPLLTPRRLALAWAALLVFLTAGFFQNTRPGWNANSQFALTCALVEQGTFRIDAYHARRDLETNDKAFYNGHFYCDKSPVTAFLGVPAFWAYSTVTRGLLGRPMDYNAARYWTTWFVEGLAAAVLAALTALLLLRRGVAPEWAACAAFFWVVATPLLPYSILFFSYLPACAMALGGWLLVERLWRPAGPSAPAVPLWHVLAGGLLFGLAAWTLNTMALIALVVTAGVALAPGRPAARGARLAAWAVGGLLGIAGHFIYTRAIFGSWGSPYQYEFDPFFREQMARGLMGATRPRPLVAWLITFHPFQGLFLLFPLAAAALAGCLALLRRRGAGRLDGALALAAAAGLILYNSAYFMWWGGCGYTPRHLIPLLVLLPLGLAPWLASRSPRLVGSLFAIAALGALLNLPPVAVNPQHTINLLDEKGHVIDDPLRQQLLLDPARVGRWPSPWSELHTVFWKIHRIETEAGTKTVWGYADKNWGSALGLTGPVSLLPLLLLWGLGFWLALRDRNLWRQ